MTHFVLLAQAMPPAAFSFAWWFDAIEKIIVLALGSGITIPTVYSVPQIISFIKAHTVIKNHAAAEAIKDRFLDLLGQGVQAELATTVQTIKADYKAGKITPETYKQALLDVKNSVINTAKSHATSQGIMTDVEGVLGVSSVDAFAQQAVEMLLAQARSASAPAASSTTATAIAAPSTPTPAPVKTPTAEEIKKTEDLKKMYGDTFAILHPVTGQPLFTTPPVVTLKG